MCFHFAVARFICGLMLASRNFVETDISSTLLYRFVAQSMQGQQFTHHLFMQLFEFGALAMDN